MIEIRNLSKTFQMKSGTVDALKEINLTIQDGDIYGIIGMSGAGKSTLVRCINFLEKPTGGQVVIDGKNVDLSPTEYKLLNYLMSNTGKALSRRQILNQVWNYDYYGDLRTVDTHINRLRIKLGDKGRYIRTVRGYGYRYDGK